MKRVLALRPPAPRAPAAVLVGALAAACAASACGPSHREVTWADVQPLLAASCLECHTREAGDAQDVRRPPLATWEDASARASEMLLMVESGLMPPGGIDKSGACGELTGARPFTADETALLRAWVDAGAPRGPPTSSPRAGALAGELAGELVTSSLALGASDDAGADRQRCVAIDVDADVAVSGAPGARFLVGVRMDAPAAAHHAMVFTIADDAQLASEPWLCDGVPRALSGESALLAFAWVPGRDAVSFPAGTGIALTSRVIVQLHEHGVVDEGARATLTLGLARDVERALTIVPVAHAGFALAPGGPVEIARPVALPAGDVVGVMPHLHAAGRTLALTLDGADGEGGEGGEDACLVRVPRWDFSFQEVVFFARPLSLVEGATGTLRCAWDTSDRAQVTRWGEGSLDEMCTVFLFVAAG